MICATLLPHPVSEPILVLLLHVEHHVQVVDELEPDLRVQQALRHHPLGEHGPPEPRVVVLYESEAGILVPERPPTDDTRPASALKKPDTFSRSTAPTSVR